LQPKNPLGVGTEAHVEELIDHTRRGCSSTGDATINTRRGWRRLASILFRALRPLFLLGADVAVNVGEESASSRVKWNADPVISSEGLGKNSCRQLNPIDHIRNWLGNQFPTTSMFCLVWKTNLMVSYLRWGDTVDTTCCPPCFLVHHFCFYAIFKFYSYTTLDIIRCNTWRT